jgi:hypothetical protein
MTLGRLRVCRVSPANPESSLLHPKFCKNPSTVKINPSTVSRESGQVVLNCKRISVTIRGMYQKKQTEGGGETNSPWVFFE